MYFTSPNGMGVSFSPGDEITTTTTLYIYDPTSACSDQESFTVTITPQPTANPAGPLSACGNAAGQATFNLTTLNSTVNGGSGTVTWYEDMAATVPIANPMAYVSSGGTVYATVGTAPCPSDPVAVQLNVTPAPTANPAGPLTACDDGSGQGTFVLTTVNGVINGGSGQPVSWYEDAGATIPIATPGSYISGSATVYATVGTAPCASAPQPVQLNLNSQPDANPASIEVCSAGGGPVSINLTSVNNTVSGGAAGTVSWWQDPAPAMPIAVPSNFSVFPPGQTVYATFSNFTCASQPVPVVITIADEPTANPAGPLTVCDSGSGQGTFDLSDLNAAVAGGAGTVSWYSDMGATTLIPNPGAYVSGNTTVYATVADGSCVSDPVAVNLMVTPAPDAGSDGSTTVCNDGAVVNLPATLGGTPDAGGNWTDDDGAGVSLAIPAGVSFNGTPAGSYDFTYTVSGGAGCPSASATVTVTVNAAPTASPAGPLEACDQGGGQATFNLSALNGAISGGSGTVSWFSDAAGTVAIPNPNAYSSGSGTVYAVVTAGGCPSAPEAVTLTVNPTPAINPIADVSVCNSYTLPAIAGSSLSGGQAYFTQPNGGGSSFQPGDEITSTITLFAYDDNAGCTDEESFTITVGSPPDAQETDLVGCPDASGQAIFDLTTAESTVNGGSGLPVNWYQDPGATLPIANPSAYLSGGGLVYATVDGGAGCISAPAAIALLLATPPIVDFSADETDICGQQAVTLTFSLPAGFYGFDLSISDAGGTTVLTYNGITNFSDLIFNIDETTTFTLSAITDEDTGCSFTLNPPIEVVVTASDLIANPAALAACANAAGQATFDLSDADGEVSGGQAVTVAYFLDAAATSPVPMPAAYATLGGTVYAVIDNGSCTSEPVPVTLTANPAPSLNLTVAQPISCASALDGALDLAVSGGAGSYNFNWNINALDGLQNPSGLGAGAYSVTVSDADGCVATAAITLAAPAALVLNCSQVSPESAAGAADGVGQVVVSGGTAPYTIAYTGPENGSQSAAAAGTATIANLTPGVYNITVTDANGCESTCSFTIAGANCALSIVVDGAISPCFGAMNGSIFVTAFNATGNLAYDWNIDSLDGQADSQTLPAGFYAVTVTDDAGCTATGSITLSTPPAVTITPTVLSPASGPGFADGVVEIAYGNGPAPYILVVYGLNNDTLYNVANLPANGVDTLTNVPAGQFFINLYDSNGCLAFTGFFMCGYLDLSIAAQDVSCAGAADGSAIATVGGVRGDLTFNWSNGMTNDTLMGLAPGTYILTVTDTLSVSLACFATDTVSIGAPAALLLACAQATAPSSPGAGDASATLTITGGTAPYDLSYTGPTSGSQSGIAAAGPFALPGLSAGSYTFTLTDANGCQATCDLVITDNPCQLAASLTGIDPGCDGEADGALDLTTTGGTGMLQYNWNVDALDGQEDPMNLSAGIYSVTVTDAAGCTATAADTLVAPPALTLSCGQSAPASGPANNDGAAAISFGGGAAPYTIAITGPLTINLPANAPASPIIPNLLPGNYNLLLTDANGCTLSCDFVISDNSCPLTIAINGQPESCANANDGAVFVTATGAAPYSFAWSPAGAGDTLTALAPGLYSVTVTDDNGCQASANYTVVAGAPLPGLTATGGGLVCEGDCATVDLAFTGAPPFILDYTVQNATAAFTRTDTFPAAAAQLQLCPADFSFAPGDFEVVFNNLTSGNGCGAALDDTLSFRLATPVVMDLSPTLCDGESVVVNGQTYDAARPAGAETIVGGAANGCDSIINIALTFLPPAVSNFNADICPGETITIGTETFSDSRLSGLVVLSGAGAGGCDSAVNVALNLLPTASFAVSETLCAGESRIIGGQTFDAAMPTGTVTLAGAAANGCDSVITVSLSFRAPAINNLSATLCPGETLTVGNSTFSQANPTGSVVLPGAAAGGCDSTVNVALTYLTAPVVNLSQTLCPGETLTVGSQTFSAANPTGTVALTAANGCDSTVNVALSFFAPAEGSFTATLCPDELVIIGDQTFNFNNPSGSVTLTSANGCDSLVTVSLSFNPAAVSNINRTLCAGQTLTVGAQTFSAANPTGVVILPNASFLGCDSTVIVSLDFLPALSAALSGGADICAGETAVLTLSLSGANAFDVTYSDGSGAPILITGAVNGQTISVSPTATATYSLLQATAAGSDCPVVISGSALVRVSNLDARIEAVTDYDGFEVSCPENADGGARVIVASGVAPYQFDWSTGDATVAIDNLAADVLYSVVVTDGAGCRDTADITLAAPPPIVLAAEGVATGCFGSRDGYIVVSAVSGGSGGYEYSLDGQFFAALGALPATLPDLSAGAYTLVVQDENDCRAELPVTVNPAPELLLDLGLNQIINLGDSVRLEAIANFVPALLTWQPAGLLSRPDSLISYAYPQETVWFQLTAEDANGCVVSDQVLVTVNEQVAVYIPSAFSPDQDGANDILYVFAGAGVAEVKRFQIYDRWGNQLFADGPFQPNDPRHGWDGNFQGRPMNAAVYVYYAEVLLSTGKVVLLKGDVTLVR